MWDPSEPVFTEAVAGSSRPAAYYLAESRDGLYVPYVVRTPADEGRFPFVFLAARPLSSRTSWPSSVTAPGTRSRGPDRTAAG